VEARPAAKNKSPLPGLTRLMERSTLRFTALAALAAMSCSRVEYQALLGDPYELDSVDRSAPSAGEAVECRPQQLSSYGGTHIKLEPHATMAEPFKVRVARFESLVAELGEEVYGRAPSRILNAGAYACRRVEHNQRRVSEHALGNALDVTGFRFPALPPVQPGNGGSPSRRHPSLPKRLERAFTLTVVRDYPQATGAPDEVAGKHREFFEKLASALRTRNLFRVALGPPDPRHRTHLHLDMAPWTYRNL
jgi:hypothetical protein